MKSASIGFLIAVIAITTNSATASDAADRAYEEAAQGQASPQDLIREISKLKKRVQFLEEKLQKNSKTKELDRVQGIEDIVFDNSRILKQEIGKQYSGDDKHYLNVLGNMQESLQFRRELIKSTQGRLKFYNFTGRKRVLYINGAPRTVLKNKSYINVPIGEVAIQHPGQEKPEILSVERWEFKNNRFEQVYELNAR